MSERSYLNMEGGDFLAAVGDDASKWAAAFCEIASSKGLTIDEDWMIGWFANAIEHSSDVRRRRVPPGSDPSPAPCLDAKEMMRDVFTSWLKHRAASPAEPAARHTTDAMERARLPDDEGWWSWIRTNPGTDVSRLLAELDKRDAEINALREGRPDARERAKAVTKHIFQHIGNHDYKSGVGWLNGSPHDGVEKLVTAAITSADEQERQACAEACQQYEGKLRRGAAHEADIEDRVLLERKANIAANCAALIRSRSAEPPDAEGGE